VSGDAAASVDVFQEYVEPLAATLTRDLGCDQDDAHDSAIDAIFEYLGTPSSFQVGRGRLATFLSNIAKKRAIDRLRSRSAGSDRAERFAEAVELASPAPNEQMMAEVEARRIWAIVESSVSDRRDRNALQLILAGEGSTMALASVLGLATLSEVDRQREVKRHRDRLLKVLERLGERLRDGDE
jgi:RNA polymerase sigma-70 factor (ECF subfamily)